MVCFYPRQAYRSKIVNSSGKRSLVFEKDDAIPFSDITIPCCQCAGCRLERSRQWALRCVHEAKLHDHNCFITLTYNDENLPSDIGLHHKHFQDFMKRLREHIVYERAKKIQDASGGNLTIRRSKVIAREYFKKFGGLPRYYMAGEYGDNFGRPHFHACIFGYNFPDRENAFRRNGLPVDRSDTLEKLWTFGFSSVGNVTFKSAAYVARYVMKKRTFIDDESRFFHYAVIDDDTGEMIERSPEYNAMSRRPGIGKGWIDEFMSDVYPCDNVVENGVKMRPPRYYDSQFELLSPDEYAKLKDKRKKSAIKHKDNNTPERLAVREKVFMRKIDKLERILV